MTEPVSIEYTITPTEFAAGLRLYWFRRGKYALLPALTILSAITATVVGSAFLWVAAYLAIVSILFPWLMPRRAWRRSARHGEAHAYQFATEGVAMQIPDASTLAAWSYFTGVVESRNLYVLTSTASVIVIIPKRAFRSLEDEAGFRELVTTNLAGH